MAGLFVSSSDGESKLQISFVQNLTWRPVQSRRSQVRQSYNCPELSTSLRLPSTPCRLRFSDKHLGVSEFYEPSYPPVAEKE
jgi:hypothetical protein